MDMFKLENPVKLYFGPGSLEELKSEAVGVGKRALIVTGTNSARKTGILQKVTNILEDAGVEYILFEKITPNPSSRIIDEGVKLFKDKKCDFVIGIGGGSAIDASKAIALCAQNEGDIVDYQPGGKYCTKEPQKAFPIVAITTTAGTGTEINCYLVITNAETNEKPGIGFDCTYPTLSIVDPNLMLSVPVGVTADTGVDVFFHAMEAYISTGASLYSDMIAKEAMELVVENLSKVLIDGKDLEARTKMAWANTLAGLAIDYAGTVAIHGAAHPISGHFNAAHGKTLSALAVSYLRNNYRANTKKFAEISKLLGFKREDVTIEELAEKSSEALNDFLKSVGRDITLSSLGVTKADIPVLVVDAFKTMEGAILNNPQKLNQKDIERIYLESL